MKISYRIKFFIVTFFERLLSKDLFLAYFCKCFAIIMLGSMLQSCNLNRPIKIVDLNLQKETIIEFYSIINEHRIYSFDIQFMFEDDVSKKKALKAAGTSYDNCKNKIECGIPINASIYIHNSNNILIQTKNTKSSGYYLMSGSYYARNILDSPLKPGKYFITIRFEAISENVSDVKIRFYLWPNPKSGVLRD